MDKNTITGFVLIAVILFGFTFFQNRQARKQAEIKAQADSLAMVESIRAQALLAAEDSLAIARGQSSVMTLAVSGTSGTSGTSLSGASGEASVSIFKDAALDSAFIAKAGVAVIANDKISVTFTTKGAQPLTVEVKDYFNYDSTALVLFKPGGCEFNYSIYAGEYIQTKDFTFDVVEATDSSVVMRLPFSGGAYIEQRYSLAKGSYSVDHILSFVGMENVIPRNVTSCDLDFNVTVPRMEKGFKNESQYSKLDYYFNGDKKPESLGNGGKRSKGSKRIDSKLSWIAFQQQFFSTILRAPDEFASAELSVNFFQQDDPDHNLMHCTAKMREEFQMSPRVDIPHEFYFGPNHFQTLNSYDQKYEKIIPLGGWLVGWFTRYVIIPLFNFFNRFIDNFGLIILLMTVVIKIVVMPLTNKSFLSSAKMAVLKPEIEKINAKYPKQEDAMKKQQATMDLYKRAGVNMMGGCLPTLLTLPILWAMFRFFPASIELRQQSFLWCHDLSAYDSILDYGRSIFLFGDHLSLFALLMAVTMWLYSRMTLNGQPSANDPNASSMRFMSLWLMPIMMFFICNNLSAALSYYYLLSQLFAILQNWVIRKWFVHPERIMAKLKESEGKPLPKSKWQKRLEEAQKMQEQQLRQQQRRR